MLMSFFIFCCCGYHENDLPDPKVMNFSLDCRLMRQKRDHDSEFMSFVHSQRGSHRPQLDALLLKPVQHVVECERILSNLLERTSETHRDYNELSKMVAKFKQIVKERQEDVVEAENEVCIIVIYFYRFFL